MKKQDNKNKIFERIESELLSTLFNYAVLFLDKKIKPKHNVKNQKVSNIEDIINNLLLKNLNQNVKTDKNVIINSNGIFYSINLKRQKINNERPNNYFISIKYEENQAEEKLLLSIKKPEGNYSAEIINKKDIKDNAAPYSVTIFYKDSYAEERLSINYKRQLNKYIKKHIESKEDMTNMVPLKWLNILPETSMGSILGFTYLGENFMGRRADLVGKTARMVDIHESIHTPDEYETRILTDWIMSREKAKYVK